MASQSTTVSGAPPRDPAHKLAFWCNFTYVMLQRSKADALPDPMASVIDWGRSPGAGGVRRRFSKASLVTRVVSLTPLARALSARPRAY